MVCLNACEKIELWSANDRPSTKLTTSQKKLPSIDTIIWHCACTGVRGFANIEECAIGAAHSLDAFNFLSGVLFAVVFVTLSLAFLILTRIMNKVGTLFYHSVTVLLFLSIVLGLSDIVYSFYIASQVYGQFEEFQQGQVNCSSLVYYSSFVSVIIVFIYTFVDIGLVVLVCLWLICDFHDGPIIRC
jgi:hypothetical protein